MCRMRSAQCTTTISRQKKKNENWIELTYIYSACRWFIRIIYAHEPPALIFVTYTTCMTCKTRGSVHIRYPFLVFTRRPSPCGNTYPARVSKSVTKRVTDRRSGFSVFFFRLPRLVSHPRTLSFFNPWYRTWTDLHTRAIYISNSSRMHYWFSRAMKCFLFIFYRCVRKHDDFVNIVPIFNVSTLKW